MTSVQLRAFRAAVRLAAVRLGPFTPVAAHRSRVLVRRVIPVAISFTRALAENRRRDLESADVP